MDPRQSFRVFLAQVAPAHAVGVADGEHHAQQDEAAGGEVAGAGTGVGEQPGCRVEGVVDCGVARVDVIEFGMERFDARVTSPPRIALNDSTLEGVIQFLYVAILE